MKDTIANNDCSQLSYSARTRSYHAMKTILTTLPFLQQEAQCKISKILQEKLLFRFWNTPIKQLISYKGQIFSKDSFKWTTHKIARSAKLVPDEYFVKSDNTWRNNIDSKIL